MNRTEMIDHLNNITLNGLDEKIQRLKRQLTDDTLELAFKVKIDEWVTWESGSSTSVLWPVVWIPVQSVRKSFFLAQ